MTKDGATYLNTLYLEPTYGLANRMRAIASGLELARETGKTLIIVWVNDAELNCPFHTLFEPIPEVHFINKPIYWQYMKVSNQTSLIPSIVVGLINKTMGFDFCIKETDGNSIGSKWNIYKVIERHKRVYIQTSADFIKHDSILKQFKPVTTLQNQINDRTKGFIDHTIGLHIRRTDHVDAITNSPLELFANRIDALLLKDPETNFYLSTDDPETEDYLKKLYAEKIIIYPKNFSRNSEEGIKDAVLDMFCLSRTKKIIGSFNSTFSNIASRINQIELEIIKVKHVTN